MNIKLLFSSIFFLLITNVFSQTNLNQYKYVVVPNKFEFLKEKDKYQLNSLTKFLFEKYGFKAFIKGEDYPADLKTNRCLTLESDVLKESGVFKTKLKVVLKDCNDQVVYTSPIGESREKEYDKAYNFALRNAFKYLEGLNYSYEPNESITSLATVPNAQQVETKNEVSKEIKELKAEIENLKKQKEEAKKEEAIVKHNTKPLTKIESAKKIETAKPVIQKVSSDILYAQEITNGFQLVDSSPKVVYKIKHTGLENVFLVQDKSALIYKKGDKWIIEYYSGNALKTEVLNIKF